MCDGTQLLARVATRSGIFPILYFWAIKVRSSIITHVNVMHGVQEWKAMEDYVLMAAIV